VLLNKEADKKLSHLAIELMMIS